MDTQIGAGVHVGRGVHVGASTPAGGFFGMVAVIILLFPGVIWFITGVYLLATIVGAMLGGDQVLDEDVAELNLVCFVVTIIEVAVYALISVAI